MEKEIADYLAGEFWSEAERLNLCREEIVVTMGFMVAQRFPEATMADVAAAFSLTLEMFTGRRKKH